MITDPSETQPISSDSQTPETPMQTPPQQMETQAPAQAQPASPVKQGMSEDTKTIITVLLLIFVFPIGLIVMFFWPKWKWWVKLLVAFPVLALGFLLVSAILLVAVNPSEQIERAECVTACQSTGATDCVAYCADVDGTYEAAPAMDEDAMKQYSSDQLGFTLDLPAEWPDLYLQEEEKAVHFSMMLQEPSGGITEQRVFSIDVLEKNEDISYGRILLNTKDDKVLVFYPALDAVVTPGSVDDQNLKMMTENLFTSVHTGIRLK